MYIWSTEALKVFPLKGPKKESLDHTGPHAPDIFNSPLSS